MKQIVRIFATLVIVTGLFYGCAGFGKSTDGNNWYGIMGSRTYAEHQEHLLLMKMQEEQLEERKEARARTTGSVDAADTAAGTTYEGWIENKTSSLRTAQVIQVILLARERYREVSTITSVALEAFTGINLDLPEGYYVVKWSNGSTDLIGVRPNKICTVAKTIITPDGKGGENKSIKTENVYFFSICIR